MLKQVSQYKNEGKTIVSTYQKIDKIVQIYTDGTFSLTGYSKEYEDIRDIAFSFRVLGEHLCLQLKLCDAEDITLMKRQEDIDLEKLRLLETELRQVQQRLRYRLHLNEGSVNST